MAKTIADELAKSQREISVAEFFEKIAMADGLFRSTE